VTPQNIVIFLALPGLAFGLNTLVEGWALKTFSKIPWNKASTASLCANALSIPCLLALKSLLDHWDAWLPYNPLGKTWEIIFIWICATMIANALELVVIKWAFKYPTPTGFLLSTTFANSLTAMADLYESFKETL
jgi:hypothetical protein